MQTQTFRENAGTIGENLIRNFQENASPLIEASIQKIKQIDYKGIYARNAVVIKNAFAKVKSFFIGTASTSSWESGPSNSSNKKFLLLAGLMVLIVGIFGVLFFSSMSGQNTLGVTDERPDATEAKKTINLNKALQFPIRNEKGKEVSKFSYEITSAELYDSIIVKGQRARAVKGRVFLIFNLKITNSNDQAVEINTRDFLRISVNNKKELIAPDIHNDPVQTQAISTKYTRVGVAINESDKNIKLQVGEITGKKQTLEINF